MTQGSNFDVIIIGAGAAGMMCAIEAGQRGRRVAVIDHAKAAGEKIRISGGGRCNFTNLDIAAENFHGANPRFALSALNRYSQHDFIKLVENSGIAYHEKTLGQLFCDGRSQEIITMLLDKMSAAGVTLMLRTEVASVTASASGYRLETSNGVLNCPALSLPVEARASRKWARPILATASPISSICRLSRPLRRSCP